MGHSASMAYGDFAKGGVVLGVSLFLVGLLGHVFGPVLFGPLPAWELTLFTWMEGVGILIALLSPFIFAVALPLIE